MLFGCIFSNSFNFIEQQTLVDVHADQVCYAHFLQVYFSASLMLDHLEMPSFQTLSFDSEQQRQEIL